MMAKTTNNKYVLQYEKKTDKIPNNMMTEALSLYTYLLEWQVHKIKN